MIQKGCAAMSYPFQLPPLPYPPDALSPCIGLAAMQLHHDKLFAAYVDRLNQTLAPWPQFQSWSLERLILHWSELPGSIRTDVRRFAGGVYNHALYFASMNRPRTTRPSQALLGAIRRDFGSTEDFFRALVHQAASVFGSGYTWLTSSAAGRLSLSITPNQETPLPLTPLMNLDLWEHAFLLDHQNLRAEYVACFLDLIDWDAVSQRYEAVLSAVPPWPAP